MDNNLKAYTLMPEPNMTYLAKTKDIPTIAQPMSGSTMGLLMILSTLQYSNSYLPPSYSNAASQAGKAAYVQSGGQAMQDKLTSKATQEATDIMHSIGITDTEAGVAVGAAKVVRDKQINVRGPRIFSGKTNLSVGQDRASFGLGFDLP